MDNLDNIINLALQHLEELTQIDFNYDVNLDTDFTILDAVAESLDFNI